LSITSNIIDVFFPPLNSKLLNSTNIKYGGKYK